MVVLPNGSDITELIMFNTLIPQGRPGNLRRLGLPQGSHHYQATKIYIDHDRPLGALNRNEPLIVDPAQADLILEIMNWDLRVFFVVRIQALVETIAVNIRRLSRVMGRVEGGCYGHGDSDG